MAVAMSNAPAKAFDSRRICLMECLPGFPAYLRMQI